MGNRSTLYLEVGGSRTAHREAKYRLPLLWLACFEPGDVIATTEEGEEEVLLATSQERALLMLERRRPALGALISNLDPFLTEWTSFLRDLGPGRLVVDATEVLMMDWDDDEDPGRIRTALRAFDEPVEEAWVALLGLCSLSDHLDRATGVVSTPEPRRLRELDPALAELPNAGRSLPAEPAAEALMGFPAAPVFAPRS